MFDKADLVAALIEAMGEPFGAQRVHTLWLQGPLLGFRNSGALAPRESL